MNRGAPAQDREEEKAPFDVNDAESGVRVFSSALDWIASDKSRRIEVVHRLKKVEELSDD